MIRRFNRYELKYLIPVQDIRWITKDLEDLARPDEHGGLKGYRVISLYYDSPGRDFFWAKLDGIKYRRKLRLRIYPEGDLESVRDGMVEIKQRINRTVQKRRLRLPLNEAENLLSGEFDFHREDLDALDQQVASEVQYMVYAMHLQPSCIISYHRRAFEGGYYDAGLRITFDTDLRCRVHGLTVNQDAKNYMFLPPDWCVMEVKVNDAVPDWVTSLLARYNCQIRRVSKYCAGLARAMNTRIIPLSLSPGPEMEERIHG